MIKGLGLNLFEIENIEVGEFNKKFKRNTYV